MSVGPSTWDITLQRLRALFGPVQLAPGRAGTMMSLQLQPTPDLRIALVSSNGADCILGIVTGAPGVAFVFPENRVSQWTSNWLMQYLAWQTDWMDNATFQDIGVPQGVAPTRPPPGPAPVQGTLLSAGQAHHGGLFSPDDLALDMLWNGFAHANLPPPRGWEDITLLMVDLV